MRTKILVNGMQYNVEVWMMAPLGGNYRFGVQALGGRKVASYAIRLSEEFIEDEIDNDKKKEYLETVALRVVEIHFGDMLTMTPHAVIANLVVWFRDAKRQLDQVNINEK